MSLILYDVQKDEFREATQADLDNAINEAVLRSKFIVERGLLEDFRAYRKDIENG